MSDEHSAAKMAAGAATLATAFIAVGTPEDPNAVRYATKEDWERCLKHPIHPVPYLPGQTHAANFAHNWTDGARVVIIWGPIVLLVLWAILALL